MAATAVNGARQDRLAKEEAIVETFRRKLREAWNSRAVGEMSIRLTFKDGGVCKTRVGMTVEYEFVDG
jgi:hypothetical protein